MVRTLLLSPPHKVVVKTFVTALTSTNLAQFFLDASMSYAEIPPNLKGVIKIGQLANIHFAISKKAKDGKQFRYFGRLMEYSPIVQQSHKVPMDVHKPDTVVRCSKSAKRQTQKYPMSYWTDRNFIVRPPSDL
jgi:hypothetical protein